MSDARELNSEEIITRLRTEAETIMSMRRDRPGYGTSPIFLNEVADLIEELTTCEARP